MKIGEDGVALDHAPPSQPQGQPMSLRPAVPATPPPSQPRTKSTTASEKPTPALTARQSEEKRTGDGGTRGSEGQEKGQDLSARGSVSSSKWFRCHPSRCEENGIRKGCHSSFHPEQVQQLTQIQQQAPWIYGLTGTGLTHSIPRLGFLELKREGSTRNSWRKIDSLRC